MHEKECRASVSTLPTRHPPAALPDCHSFHSPLSIPSGPPPEGSSRTRTVGGLTAPEPGTQSGTGMLTAGLRPWPDVTAAPSCSLPCLQDSRGTRGGTCVGSLLRMARKWSPSVGAPLPPQTGQGHSDAWSFHPQPDGGKKDRDIAWGWQMRGNNDVCGPLWPGLLPLRVLKCPSPRDENYQGSH